jgi:hypothetical protein
MSSKPKVLLYDIETSPIISYTWGIWDQNVGLNQIKEDWHVLAFAAKWLGDPPSKMFYQDQRNAKDIRNDKPLLKAIWKLLDESEIVITQNGRSFDQKKLNARFIINGIEPPSSSKHIDTKVLAKKHFAFTSNKLEYMTDKLCTKYKKLKHSKFSGFELWRECMSGNREAWDEMEKYNKYDVLSLEELYYKISPWGTNVNFSSYTGQDTCNCGGEFVKNGYDFTQTGKYQRYRCKACGLELRGRVNLNPKGTPTKVRTVR